MRTLFAPPKALQVSWEVPTSSGEDSTSDVYVGLVPLTNGRGEQPLYKCGHFDGDHSIIIVSPPYAHVFSHPILTR